MFKERASYRELLIREIGEKKYAEIAKGFDVLGNIATIDADRTVAKKVGKIIMDTHSGVETVLGKGSPVRGKYRTRKYFFVLGKRNYVAHYNENGASFVFDVRKVYFSPRLAFERKRVTDLVKDGENVVVMFSGIAPFAVEIAKKNKRSKVVAIELNRAGHKYALENIKLNKTGNVIPILCDAKKPPKKYLNFADRIIMPLPTDSYSFIGPAFKMAKKKCVIHYYAFVEDDGAHEIERLMDFSKKNGRKFKVIGKRVVRPYSSRISEMCIDFQLS